MRGRVCVVTGASSGIGRAATLGLARHGATVVMMVRDRARGETIRSALGRESGNSDIGLVCVDLASMSSVREAASEVGERFPRIHALVNNAGVHPARRGRTTEGFELTFATNHLGPFLLTHLLLPRLRAGAPSRIVVVTSWFERFGRLGVDDVREGRPLDPFRAYARSKLANLLFAFALARRLEGTGVTVNAVHPGLVATALLRDLPAWLRASWEWLLLSPEQGARTIVRLASAPELRDVTGRYLGPSGRAARASRRARDTRLSEQLWRFSEELTGLIGSHSR